MEAHAKKSSWPPDCPLYWLFINISFLILTFCGNIGIKELVDLLDQENEQTIPIKELGTLIRAMGQIPTEAELDRMVKKIEADYTSFGMSTGVVRLPEVLALMESLPRGELGSQAELREAFESFEHCSACDGDKPDYMLAAKFRHYMTFMGEPVTDEELNHLVKHFMVDGDGQVNIDGAWIERYIIIAHAIISRLLPIWFDCVSNLIKL